MSASVHSGPYRFSKADHRPLDDVKVNEIEHGLTLTVNGKRAVQVESCFAGRLATELLACVRHGKLSDATLGRTQFRAFRDGELIKLLFSVVDGEAQEWDWIRLAKPQAESLLAHMYKFLPPVGSAEIDSQDFERPTLSLE